MTAGENCKRCGTPFEGKGRCKQCKRAYDAERYKRERNKVITRAKKWSDANRERISKLARCRKYGLKLGEFENMFTIQKGECAICKCRINEKTAHVDHDHESGRVRALLCFNCNIGLGKFSDSVELLMNAATFLLKHRTAQTHIVLTASSNGVWSNDCAK